MPSKRALLEKLRFEVEKKGEGEHSCFYTDVTKDQEKRKSTGNRKTRFVLCTDDAELCAKFEAEKDRIFRKVRNKAIMLTLMERAWEEALCDSESDRIIAAEEVLSERG